MPSRTSAPILARALNLAASASLAFRFGFTVESSASSSSSSDDPARLRLQSAGTMRPLASLVLATSIGIGLSQLGVTSRSRDDGFAPPGRLRRLRPTSTGSCTVERIVWSIALVGPLLTHRSVPPFVSVPESGFRSGIEDCDGLVFPRFLHGHTYALPGPTNAPNGPETTCGCNDLFGLRMPDGPSAGALNVRSTRKLAGELEAPHAGLRAFRVRLRVREALLRPQREQSAHMWAGQPVASLHPAGRGGSGSGRTWHWDSKSLPSMQPGRAWGASISAGDTRLHGPPSTSAVSCTHASQWTFSGSSLVSAVPHARVCAQVRAGTPAAAP
jgi:hypothetical protein